MHELLRRINFYTLVYSLFHIFNTFPGDEKVGASRNYFVSVIRTFGYGCYNNSQM